MPAFDPDYRSDHAETVTITQVDDGVDDYSTLAYGAIDESASNYPGILWGIPPFWPSSDLHQVAWTGIPPIGTDDAYDHANTGPSSFGARHRGSVLLAPGRYVVRFKAKWQVLTEARGSSQSGTYTVRTALGNAVQWEAMVDPYTDATIFTLGVDPSPTFENYDSQAYAVFEIGEPAVLWNNVAIIGPPLWGRILHNTHACELTIERAADTAAAGPIVGGAVAAGRAPGAIVRA